MDKKTLRQKLFDVQGEIPKIVKDQKNLHFKNKYYDINTLLEVVKPILRNHKLLLTQSLSNVDGRLALRTEIVDTEAVADKITDVCTLPDLADPQKAGSAISYFRRYSIVSMLGIESEDDDGESTRGNTSEPIKTNFKL